MRIFLTGATGYIGSAVLGALVRQGHTVTGLVRSTAKARRVTAAGARAVVGDLSRLESYREALVDQEGYVLAAFDSSGAGVELDRQSIEAIRAAAHGRPGVPVVYTSGIWALGPAPSPVDESAPVNPIEIVRWRPAHEQLVLDAGATGLRPIVIRPGIVYGGSAGIIGDLFRQAVTGAIRVIGDGTNRWPLVHRADLAALYALVLAEQGASGIYHATDGCDERAGDVAEAIAKVVSNAQIARVPVSEVRPALGPFADALALDQVVRSPRAAALGWEPAVRSLSAHVASLYEEWQATTEA